MDKEFEDKVEAFSGVLSKHRFKRVAEYYDPQSFGNSILEYASKSETFGFEFVKDRSDFIKYIFPSSAPDKYFLLGMVL